MQVPSSIGCTWGREKLSPSPWSRSSFLSSSVEDIERNSVSILVRCLNLGWWRAPSSSQFDHSPFSFSSPFPAASPYTPHTCVSVLLSLGILCGNQTFSSKLAVLEYAVWHWEASCVTFSPNPTPGTVFRRDWCEQEAPLEKLWSCYFLRNRQPVEHISETWLRKFSFRGHKDQETMTLIKKENKSPQRSSWNHNSCNHLAMVQHSCIMSRQQQEATSRTPVGWQHTNPTSNGDTLSSSKGKKLQLLQVSPGSGNTWLEKQKLTTASPWALWLGLQVC